VDNLFPPAEGLVHLVVGWTGHRRLPEAAGLTDVVAQAFDEIERYGAASGRTVVCVGSVAKGADLLFCEEALRRSLPLLVLLPVEASQFEADAEPATRDRIKAVLAHCRAVETVHPPAAVPASGFLEAGVRTVNDCDVLLTIWDGQPAEGAGGTGEIVQYALEVKRAIAHIHPTTGELSWMRKLPALPGRARVPPTEPLLCRADVARLFHRLDEAADQYARPARSLLFRIICYHLAASAVMVLALAAYSEMYYGFQGRTAGHWVGFATMVKVALLGYALYLVYRHRVPHSSWMDHRIRAELCRSYLALWNLPRWAIRAPFAPISALAHTRRDLYIAWHFDATGEVDLAQAKKSYLDPDSLIASDGSGGRIASQLDYLRKNAAATHLRYRRLRRIATWSTGSAIVLGVISCVFIILTSGDSAGDAGTGQAIAKMLLKFLAVTLPLVSATLLSYATASDLKRRSTRYAELAQRLDRLEHQIMQARSWADLGLAIELTEQLLLAEVAEWHAFTRFAGDPH